MANAIAIAESSPSRSSGSSIGWRVGSLRGFDAAAGLGEDSGEAADASTGQIFADQ